MFGLTTRSLNTNLDVQRTAIIQRDENGYGLTISGDQPCFVASVKQGGAAEKAGVKQGDKIIKVNGKLVTQSGHTEVVKLIRSGSYVALTLLRPGNAPLGSDWNSSAKKVTKPESKAVHKIWKLRKTNPSDSKLQDKLREKEKTLKSLEAQVPGGTGNFSEDSQFALWPRIIRCLEVVEKRGLHSKGIYRISCIRNKMENLYQMLDHDPESVDLNLEDMNTICSVVKHYLRQCPEPLLTFKLYQSFIQIAQDNMKGDRNKENTVERLRDLIDKLPISNRKACEILICHLQRVASHVDENYMNSKNLGAVFGPLLLRPQNSQGLSAVSDLQYGSLIVTLLIDSAESLFGYKMDCEIKSGESTDEMNSQQMRNIAGKTSMVPEELFNPRDVEMYLKAIEEGKERDRLVRVMVVGHFAQGKTSLTRRLFGQSVEGVKSTNGIEVHCKQCDKNGTHWKNKPSVEHVDDMTSRLVNVASKLLNTHDQQSDVTTDIPDESNGPVKQSNHPVAENNSTNLSESKYDANSLMFKYEANLLKSKYDVNSLESKYDANSLESKYDANSQESKYDAKSVDSESKYDKDVVAQFAQKMNASKTCSSAIADQDDSIDINVWDFGGQFVYYATHQIFHSKNAIYLLVFNLKESFERMLIDEDFPNNKYTMKSCLEFWMESVHSFVGSNDGKEPTVILVGTHKGDCDGKENEQLEAVKDIACATGTINHIYPTQFAVECMDPHDTSLELLRSDICKLGQEKTQHRMIPAKWIPLEKKLLDIRNKKIVQLVDIVKIDSENSHPIRDEEQIKLFLKYHHEKGSLIFFDEEKLHEFVVLDPQFLIDAFKCIITSQRFYRWKPDLKDLGEKLMNSGILEMDLLDEIWGNDETSQFYSFKDVLLAFMQRLRILAEMNDVTDTTRAEHVERTFLVPSLLKGQADEKVMDAFLPPCKRKSNISLILKLENISVLPLIYQRVMTAVLAKWSPIYFPDGNPLLFRDIGVFLLNYQHAGLIAVHSGGLEMAVVSLCPEGPVDAAVCDQFRRYIEMVVLHEFEKFSSGSEKDLYEYYLRCNHSEHGRKGSRNVHDLKKVKCCQEVCCPDYGHHVVNMRESIDQWFKKENVLPDDDIPDRELTDKALSKIAQAIGKNWKLLGIDLGLGQDDVDRCEIDNLTSGVKTTIYYILKEWRKRYPKQNSMKFLIRQMKECEGLTVNWDKINNIIDNF